MHLTSARALAAAAALAAGFGVAVAAEIELPGTIVMTSYTTDSAGFAQAVAIGAVLKEHYGTNLRVIPGNNDVSRQAPLKQGQAQFSSTGFGTFYSQEAVFEFADREQWGPQAVRMVMINDSDGGIGLAVDPALGVEHPADLKGRRVAQIVGAPALNLLVEAYLTFGGLTWDDVEVVEFSGFGPSLNGYIEDQVDAVIAVTDSGTSGRLMASPRGLDWVMFPESDTAGWQRLTDFAPWFVPERVTEGNGVPPEGLEFAVYYYPMLITYADTDADLVYGMVKAMVEHFDEFKDAAPGAYGWDLERQDLSYVMPYHEGAVRYFKEAGLWTEEDQANQERMLERQEVLQRTWDEVLARDLDDEAFAKAWMKARYQALTEAGFKPYFESW